MNRNVWQRCLGIKDFHRSIVSTRATISFYHGKVRAILIAVRAESNLEEGELCPKARKRKLWIINAT